jgi:sarcosine oxidase
VSNAYDVIVAGVGGMGAATCWQLARRGVRVLGLERLDIPHAMGSSHGVSRIIRLAYFEHPSYVPLLRRAYELWRETEQLAGEQLLYVTGSLDIGTPESDVLQGALTSCRVHSLFHERLDAEAVNSRFPGYRLSSKYQAVYQPEGGFVASERAIVRHVEMAHDKGAAIHAREPMVSWEPTAGGGVRVKTPRATYEAGHLVLSTGAWIGDHVPALKTKAIAERQVLGWFQPKRPEHYRLGTFPVSNLRSSVGHFYAFPVWHVPGFKIGLYHHLRQSGHADHLSRDVTAKDEAALRRGVARFFPDANGAVMGLRACLFTNTPDEHFVLDRLPGTPQVIVASPCSGHGYKFASVIGEILADLTTGKVPRLDIKLFRIDRIQ